MAFLNNLRHLCDGIDIDNLIHEIDSLKKELFSTQEKVSSYSTLMTEKDKVIASLKQSKESLTEDMVREKDMRTILDEKIRGLNQTIAELMSEKEFLNSSEQKLKDECKKATKSNAILNAKNLALTSKTSELEEKNKQLESIHTRLQSDISEKDATISAFRTNYDNLLSEFNNKKGELEEINKTKESEKAEKKKLKEDIAKLLERYHILEEKSDLLQVAVDDLTSENNRVKEDFAKTQKNIDLLTEEKSDKERDNSALNEELSQQKIENESLQQQIKKLLAEKEELTPYLYLIEAKKEQEALEEAKKKLQETLDPAMCILHSITHEEVREVLEKVIKSSQELVNSTDCTLEELNNSKENIFSETKKAEEQEKKLVEQEDIERQRKEEEEEEQKRLEEEQKRQEEEQKRLEEEQKNKLEKLVDKARLVCNTISHNDVSTPLQTVIDDTETYLKENTFDISSSDNLFRKLEYSLNEAKQKEEKAKRDENHVVKRSILEIFDTKEGDIIEAESFFQRPEHELIRWRRIFEESILAGEHRFICTNCRQDVKISGRKYERGQVAFFSHLHDSDYCEIKTTTGLSKEQIEAKKYGLIAESDRHKRLKKLIHEVLDGYASHQKGVTEVSEEKRINSNLPYMNWRKPDIIARYNDLNIVFELQLSTTFVSVVVQRDIFYRLNDYFIIWVFNFDDNQKYVDLTNLMCKDIYYANKRNVFIFDAEAQQASRERGELVLKCNWLDPDNTWHYSPTKGKRDGKLITIDELKYDKETAKPYYFDAETPYYEMHPEVKERIQKEERSKQQMIDDLQSRATREEEEAIVKRDNALKLMLENDGNVSPFKDGNKYGFKYNNVVLIPAKYSSYSEFGYNGMYKVSSNRHYGLIDKYGNELFTCDYQNFHRLSNGLIVAEHTSGFYLFGIGRIADRNPHDTISLEELTPRLFALLRNSKSLEFFIIDDEFLFKKDTNHYAFYSISGEQVISATFSNYHFTQDYSALWLQNSESRLWNLSNIDGSAKNNLEYTDYRVEIDRIIAIQPENTDVYNLKGEFIRSTDYDDIKSFCFKDYSKVIKGEFCGLVDSDFTVILSTEYESIEKYKELLIVKRNGQYGLCNEYGEFLIDSQYDKIEPLSNGVNVIVNKEGMWYIYNLIYKHLDNIPYTTVRLLLNDYLVVQSGNAYGLSNTCGKICIPVVYQEIDKFRLDYNKYNSYVFKCKLNDKVGAYSIDKKQIVIPIEYDDIDWWNQDKFKVKKNLKWGLYKICKGFFTEIKYDSISTYDDTMISVSLNGENGHISPEGKEICSETKILSDGYETKLFFSKWALFKDSKMIIPYEHDDSIEMINHNMFKVKTKGRIGIKDTNNCYIFQPRYKEIITKENCHFAIVKSIKYRREREYGWRRYNHSINVKYIEYQLYNIDGTQNGIPSKFCSTFSTMEFINSKFIWLNGYVLSLDKFAMTEHTYSSVAQFSYDGFIMVKNINYGLLGPDLKLVLPCNFDSIESWGNGLFLTRNDIKEGYSISSHARSEYSLYKKDGKICSIGVFDAIEDNNGNKTKIQKGSQFGFINRNGDIIYDNTKIINNEIIVAKVIGYIEIRTIDGNILVPLSENITDVKPFIETYFIIVKDGKQGILNVNDKKYIKCEYDSIEVWSKGILLVSKYNYSKTFSLLSLNGDSITTEEYTKISPLENGFADAERNGVTGRLDANGHEIYDIEESLNDNLVRRRCFGKCGVFDKNGHQILTFQWDDITLFSDSIILASIKKPVSTPLYNSTPNQTTSYSLFTLGGTKLIPEEFDKIRKCSNDTYIITKNSYDALFNKNFDVLIPFGKYYKFIREWTDNRYVAYLSSSYVVINKKGDIISQNKYMKIKDLQDGKAEVVFNNKTGYINQDCEELSIITENRGEWTISIFFEKYSIIKDGDTILSDLSEATFINDSLIKIKKAKDYSLYSTTLEKELPNLYKQIDNFNGSFATVINLDNTEGSIDEYGNECYDHIIELGNNLLAKRKFSKYEVFNDHKIILEGITNVSKWENDKLRITISPNNVQIFSINENKYLGEWYNIISELEDGKAKVQKNGYEGYIDANANVIPSEEICIEPNVRKIQKMGLWYIVDDDYKQIIPSSFREIGSYHGKFISFDGYKYNILDYKTSKTVPVVGTYLRDNKSTLTYEVGGRYVMVLKKILILNGKTIQDFINENKTLKLIISGINIKRNIVYAKPYKELLEKMVLPPFDIGQIVEGTIRYIRPYGIIIKCNDGRKTLIHKSRLNELGYGDYQFEKSQSITIKKTGVNEEYNKDIWEIISI